MENPDNVRDRQALITSAAKRVRAIPEPNVSLFTW